MNIPFDGQYDRRTFTKALGLVQRQTGLGQIFRLLALLLALFVVGYAIYVWFTSGVFEFARFARHLFTAILLGYYYISPSISQWASVNKLFSDTDLRTMSGYVNPQGIFITSPHAQTPIVFEWGRFFRRGKKDDLISLYTTDGIVAVFHRSFFENENSWRQFEVLVEQKVREPK